MTILYSRYIFSTLASTAKQFKFFFIQPELSFYISVRTKKSCECHFMNFNRPLRYPPEDAEYQKRHHLQGPPTEDGLQVPPPHRFSHSDSPFKYFHCFC
jgi:hypothetical protein